MAASIPAAYIPAQAPELLACVAALFLHHPTSLPALPCLCTERAFAQELLGQELLGQELGRSLQREPLQQELLGQELAQQE